MIIVTTMAAIRYIPPLYILSHQQLCQLPALTTMVTTIIFSEDHPSDESQRWRPSIAADQSQHLSPLSKDELLALHLHSFDKRVLRYVHVVTVSANVFHPPEYLNLSILILTVSLASLISFEAIWFRVNFNALHVPIDVSACFHSHPPPVPNASVYRPKTNCWLFWLVFAHCNVTRSADVICHCTSAEEWSSYWVTSTSSFSLLHHMTEFKHSPKLLPPQQR